MHNNNVTLAIMVDGKSLYEDKSNVFIPFGTEYQIFVKNNNDFDIYVKVNVSLFNDDIFLVRAKSKRTIKGFSEDDVFYSFRFIEKIKEIVDNKANRFSGSDISINVYRKDNPLETLTTRRIADEPFGTKIFTHGLGTSIHDIAFNQKNKPSIANTTEIDPNKVSISYDNTSSDLQLNGSTNSISPEIAASLSGIQTYGKPVDESIDLINIGNRMSIASFNFLFIGVDSSGHKITKPLYSKDIINCKVCNSKSKPSENYCSKCGSFIVKTAFLIDEVSEQKECCNKVLPDDYKFCPSCAKPL